MCALLLHFTTAKIRAHRRELRRAERAMLSARAEALEEVLLAQEETQTLQQQQQRKEGSWQRCGGSREERGSRLVTGWEAPRNCGYAMGAQHAPIDDEDLFQGEDELLLGGASATAIDGTNLLDGTMARWDTPPHDDDDDGGEHHNTTAAIQSEATHSGQATTTKHHHVVDTIDDELRAAFPDKKVATGAPRAPHQPTHSAMPSVGALRQLRLNDEGEEMTDC
jgi:hypothetical protein